jgi:glutaredoxin
MDITIYTRDGCSLCEQTKQALQKKNIAYSEQKIDETITRDEVVKLFPEAKKLPIVTIDGTWIGGRDETIKRLNQGTIV